MAKRLRRSSGGRGGQADDCGVMWRAMVNALIDETSPYLQQHAHNPVAWQAWGEEAFARARAEGKLVFLSIGYSTCHWCHVMEHESFEDEEVAEVMNRHFINIKVDREERPDVDAAYMAYVQATSGQGGWPMSVWLTPEGRPVFGGTYFPPRDRHQRPGLLRVCHELARLWNDDRAQMEASAAQMLEHLQRQVQPPLTWRELPASDAAAKFLDHCAGMLDGEWGGFGRAPKFPRPVLLRTLMQLSERFGRATSAGASAWDMTATTLRAMANGGIHDHLGGGFHRYSVDRYWHVPHYEKMLYDQAQLAAVYLDAWQIGHEPMFRQVAEGIFRYLLETLRDPGGGFHAAEDADSQPSAEVNERREGAYWTWRADEVAARLPARDAAIFAAAYGVEAQGNARPASDPQGELRGFNTLYRARDDEALAAQFDCPVEEIRERLDVAAQVLLAARQQRPPPRRDDKIITAWNGLTIMALARGARVLGRHDLAAAARGAAAFVRGALWDGRQLFRSYRGRRSSVAAFPADFVYLIAGLLELDAVAPADGWLAWARKLQGVLDATFWEPAQSGYLMQPGLAGEAWMRIRDDSDGAEPAPNHLAAENLLKLAALLDEAAYARRAEELLRAGADLLESQPFAAPVLLGALDLYERGVMKIQVPAALEPEVVQLLGGVYLPRAVVVAGGGPGITVCEGTVCRPFC